jgi:hypothetical protein
MNQNNVLQTLHGLHRRLTRLEVGGEPRGRREYCLTRFTGDVARVNLQLDDYTNRSIDWRTLRLLDGTFLHDALDCMLTEFIGLAKDNVDKLLTNPFWIPALCSQISVPASAPFYSDVMGITNNNGIQILVDDEVHWTKMHWRVFFQTRRHSSRFNIALHAQAPQQMGNTGWAVTMTVHPQNEEQDNYQVWEWMPIGLGV